MPNDRQKTSVIFGGDSIEEVMLANSFSVPINSFFQVHTDLAELLYQKASNSSN